MDAETVREQAKEQAYNKGWTAWLNGRPSYANPYLDSPLAIASMLLQAWKKGWEEAETTNPRHGA